MKAIYSRLIFIIVYMTSWVCYFIISKIIFLLFYIDKTSELDFSTIANIIIKGLKLDLSFSAYLTIIPFLFMSLYVWNHKKVHSVFIKTYTYIFIFIINWLLLTDLELYQHWGTRLDTTPLLYLSKPKEAMASVSYSLIFTYLLVWIVASLVFCKIFNKIIFRKINNIKKIHILHIPVLIVCTGLLILPMRGGLQTMPINQSNVYFSANMFANHAAINFAWNLLHSLDHNSQSKKNPFVKLANKAADEVISKYSVKDTLSYNLLKIDKPNVLLVIWESLPAKAIEKLGGQKDVVYNFNSLTNEGLLFTNYYSNGDRTDKGLIAILSGYYPQPNTSIIKIPSKVNSLPILSENMYDLGYESSFYYGGDLNFANMASYLYGKKISNFIDGSFFDKDNWNSKWGAHDEYLLDKLLSDTNDRKSEKPFFNTILTLTSHEPFEFPGEYKFGKNNNIDKFKSSLAYTDKCLGDFIEKAKKQDWWDDTLIVIMADHGHVMTQKGYKTHNGPEKYNIPMLWLGGALNDEYIGVVNDNISSQVDFSYTLLDILKADNSEYSFSQNIFNKSDKKYAHYIFNRGFGTINKDGFSVYDYTGERHIHQQGDSKNEMDELGKAITQKAYQDFLDR